MIRKLLALLLLVSPVVWSDDVVFPLHSEVVDVTQAPYFAKNDGTEDASAAIQKALDDHPNGNYIIYLPKGVYSISRTLSWGRGQDSSQSYRRTILQGQGPQLTILKLKAKSPGFSDPSIPKAVIYTGIGPAPRYRNAVRDLSLIIEKGNPGAVAIRFNAANQGTIDNVRIQSMDGTGVTGIDMAFAENIGPLLLRQVEIHGFDVGILTAGQLSGMTMERITLNEQKKAGILNQGQVLSIRTLQFKSNVPAVWNVGSGSMVTLIDSRLEHNRKGDRGPAIINQGGILFLRNIAASGFKQAVIDDQGTGVTELDILEYSSKTPQGLCASPRSTLRLPIAETPLVPWVGVSTWVAISGDYGATADDGTDDSKAIQQAIDDGAETIFLQPGGRYTLVKDVIIRKRLSRIVGIESKIDGKGRFIVEDGMPPTVIIERFASLAGGVIHRSTRTLVLRNLSLARYEGRDMGTGDLFLEDVSMTGPMILKFQKVWARQLHSEFDGGPWITNNGADLWVLGLTSTRGQQIVRTRASGQTEILGAHIIASNKAKTQPMFEVDTASLSIAGLKESTPLGNPYFQWIAEERKDNQVSLAASALGSVGAYKILPVYSAFIPRTGNNEMPTADAGPDQLVVLPKEILASGKTTDDGRGAGLCSTAVEWEKISGPGRVAYSNFQKPITKMSFTYPGFYWIQLTADDGQLKKRDTVRVAVWDRMLTTKDHNGDGIPSGRGADASIFQADPLGTHGGDSLLQMRFVKDSSVKTFLRFDLSALPGAITDAALQIKVKPGEDTMPVLWNIYGLKESKDFGNGKLGSKWAEDSIHWENAPGVSNVGGGYFDAKTKSGGGSDPEHTVYLGQMRWNEDWPFGYYFQNKALTDWLRSDQDKLVTLILTAETKKRVPDILAAKEQNKVSPPSLYISYMDPNRSVGGELIPGGYRMSEIKVDPVTLQVNFTVLVANPQVVRIEVYNEQGKRVLLIHEQQMPGETETPFQFNAKEMETGTYKILVSGEAFQGSKSFVLLN